MGHRPEENLPVVVGVDGSPTALDAARWAAREAARRGAPLAVIGAFSWFGTRHLGDPGFGSHYRKAMVTRARAAVSAGVEAAAEAAGGIEISGRVDDGFPVPLLVAASRRAELLVVGDRGLGGGTSPLTGSVAIGLAAHAECPVVVVRGDQPSENDGPVVVGIDGSQLSEAALEFAFRTADLREALLIAVHAWTDGALDAGLVPLLGWDDIETAEHPLLAEWLAGWEEKYPDVVVQRVVVRDRPAHAVIEQATAAAARLVVVGSHGRGGATAFVLGSVSHAVLHHAPCPVAVVRPERTP
ncbi:universal stress protein [Amycolatopsis vastitatis]|uniref:Universal stress protein UspA n=1 Tax=Amycolatopsis vastitatis TaxID=1905142 RepID=A0A229T1C5_9PSEU|nr:universal stress protein [Amycolatopsis vastitatis]OXM64701.1 universal stress protein UspA [Amycolatopsis vastitatis]